MKRVTLGDIAEIVSGGTPARNKPQYWGGSIPWVKTGEVDFCTITDTEERITEEGLKNSSTRIIPKGTILMAMYGQGKTRGQVAILGIDATINQACAAIVLNHGADRDFVYQQLAFHYFDIRKLSNSGNQNNLNADLIRSVAFPLPPSPEQRKIAAILGTWDRAINKSQALLTAKTERLAALRQQLLFGKKRFSQFGRVRWPRVQLSEILKHIFRPVNWSPKEMFRLISIRRRCGGLFRREDLLGADYKTTDLHEIRTGDFLISKRQVVHGAWAMVTKEFSGCHVSKEYSILVNKAPDVLHMPFFDWLSHEQRMWHLAFLASDGVHREKLIFDSKDFLRHYIELPPTIEEQQRIVEVLDACDQEIRLLEAELEALKLQKRGLMQKLLTGDIRVKT